MKTDKLDWQTKAMNFVKDYIDHYITDDYRVRGVFLSEIKEGVVLVND